MARSTSAIRSNPGSLGAGNGQAETPLAARIPVFVALGAIVVALFWSYWDIIVDLTKEWRRNDDYSIGQLVPFTALYLLWHDRAKLRGIRVRPCWWGLPVILLGQAARAYGLFFLYESAERYSLVLTIVGLVLLVGGYDVFRRTRWILLFLFLMVPLPGRVHNRVSGPLQTQATASAVFVLELTGVTVVREGNVILLNNNVPMAIAEACSGLRMLTAFVVVAATLAYIVRRPPWQKAVLVCSSIPIAIFCNLVRLVVTALLFIVTSSEFAERFFHDFAGLTMMPLAVLLLVGELWIMNMLVVPDRRAVPGNAKTVAN